MKKTTLLLFTFFLNTQVRANDYKQDFFDDLIKVKKKEELTLRQKREHHIKLFIRYSGLLSIISIISTFTYNKYFNYVCTTKQKKWLYPDDISNAQGIIFASLKLLLLSKYIALPSFISSLIYGLYNEHHIKTIKRKLCILEKQTKKNI
ncbi:MAG: hypothetical protein WD055_01935 [Candidatus Dependentiae bacterium]